MRLSIVRLTALAGALFFASSASAQTKLLRFPDIHGDRIVFSYGGDLWTASASGGGATRLTTHPGLELFAKFSPDGKWIAFTGQYDGDEQVYVVPSYGGVPKQLTFYPAGAPRAERWGYDNQVYGWTRDGSRILFRAGRTSWTLGQTRLYTVSPAGGSAVPLPMPLAGSGAYSPDGKKIVYSKVFRDFRPEKRYSGGQANYLAIFDFAGNSAKQISKGPRAERDAMWIGGKIYYNSDKDGTFNLYSYDVATGASEQLTHSTTWDVRWPSADPEKEKIIYEMAGELSILDTSTGVSTPIHVTVTDDGVSTRPSRVSAAGHIEDWSLSPKGERALFAARGDIFTAPIEKGFTRNLTHSSGAHDRAPAWSPDGSKIAFISDMSGEEEIYTVAQDGQSKPVQLTTGGKAQRFSPLWSPDGSRIAFRDKDARLYVLRVSDRDLKEIARDSRGRLVDYAWSPSGNNLAWSMTDPDNTTRSIYIWTPGDGRVRRVTGDYFDEHDPAWDPDGDFLYFLSDRDYHPQLSQSEFNYATARMTGIYALALRKDVKHPFPMESDEVTLDTAAAPVPKPIPAPAVKAADTSAHTGNDAVLPSRKELRIDFDGIEKRVARVPIEADNISDVMATKGQLIYAVQGARYYPGRASERKPVLNIFTLKDRKTQLLLDNAPSYAFSADGKKVMVQAGGFGVYDIGPNAAASRKAVSTDGLVVDRVPKEEWAQIFDEVWRRYRDYFYVKNMHGYDWQALHDQYKPLVQYVAHRADLNYVIQEMIAELSIQHTYIAGGDWQIPPRPAVALAGAVFELDSASGRYRIAKIYEGENEEPNYRSPLTEIGVNAKAGEYVLAIDGEDLRGDDDPYRMLRGKADRPVTLTLSATPSGASHRATYRPITSEGDLGYLDMVLANRKRVDQLSGGKVGYIHIPDMGAAGLREFIKWYYPQINKEGLVVDVRANGGGNVSRMLIERLRRELLGINYTRTSELPDTYPDQVFVGPMAAILDEYSSSDGDIFPYMFRQAKLGPLIGKRSWGGVVGINNGVPLIDGGSVNVPTSALASTDGQWVIEGHGVDPDIEVENDAASVLAGRDPQLERAVQEVMKQMPQRQHTLPPRPADKVKTGRTP